MTTASTVAAERQLDWLLGEALGGISASRTRTATLPATRLGRQRLIAAAIIVFAAAAAFGVALLHDREAMTSATAPIVGPPQGQIEWTEAYSLFELDALPNDVQNLRAFDFDDECLAALAKKGMTKLERLDLGHMAVNDKGYAVSLKITDAGIAPLAKLTGLRWLSLASCEQINGSGLAALESLPRLEHLDLTYTQVDSAAVERLQRLPNLRELSLSSCMRFHGRSLAAVARIPGLRKLELRGCTTVTAGDVISLAGLHELRHLDLSDCQGRFRGQTLSFGGEVPDDTPKEDGVGITDASIAALAVMPLETLLLGGAESLTDGIGVSLAKMTSLRTLDLSRLPKITGATLAKLPNGLVSLSLDDDSRLRGGDLRALPALPQLRELGIGNLPEMTDDDLRALLRGRDLTALRIGGGNVVRTPRGVSVPPDGALTSAVVDDLVDLRKLEKLAITGGAKWIDAAAMNKIAAMPSLVELDLSGNMTVRSAMLAGLPSCRALRSLRLVGCRGLDEQTLQVLAGAQLRCLDLRQTRLTPASILAASKSWPGCEITMPDASLFRVPAREK